MSTVIKNSKLRELLAARQRERVAAVAAVASPAQAPAEEPEINIVPKPTGSAIVYNDKQQQFIDTAVDGWAVALTGAAGCGKTTSLTGAISALMQNNRLDMLGEMDHKHLVRGSPAIALVSFTNKAVNNIKKVLPADIRGNAMTIHKLLEFEPEYYTAYDDKGNAKETMRFAPTRNKTRYLPPLNIIVIDEAPMLAVQLYNQLVEAIDPSCPPQIIMLGDIQQLPPVFGKSVFIHAVQRGIKVIELTEVYRQALGSPIISLATEVIKGKQIPISKLESFSKSTDKGRVLIKPWKQKLSDIAAIKLMGMWLPEQIDSGTYDPEEDMIITPYNEAFGTIVLNKIIASHVAQKLGAEVHEIYAGVKKQYFRVGERVLYNKSDARIVSIERNKNYIGKLPRRASATLNYSGIESNPDAGKELSADAVEEVDFMLTAMANHTEDGERVSRQASHTIKIRIDDLDLETSISTSGEINKLDLGYAITIYKSQGSEYRKVFFITHGSQSGQIFRESVYTGITRAKEELIIICEPNFFVKGINTQRLPGNNLAEKIEAFDRTMKISKTGDSELPQWEALFRMQHD